MRFNVATTISFLHDLGFRDIEIMDDKSINGIRGNIKHFGLAIKMTDDNNHLQVSHYSMTVHGGGGGALGFIMEITFKDRKLVT